MDRQKAMQQITSLSANPRRTDVADHFSRINTLQKDASFRLDGSCPCGRNRRNYFSNSFLYCPYPSFSRSSFGIKRSAAEFMQYLRPVGFGPSLKT